MATEILHGTLEETNFPSRLMLARNTIHLVLYASILLILMFAVLLVKYYSRFLTDEKKGGKNESLFHLKYDDSDEECLETTSLLHHSSFMQQISTGSNTDSDLRLIRTARDLEGSRIKVLPNQKSEETLFKSKP